MNRILSNKYYSMSASLFRNYSIKSIAAPSFRNCIVAKAPAQPTQAIVCKPILYQLLTSNAFRQLQCKSYASYAPINIDARNLTKDVIVYKYNNAKFFKLMNIFAIVQFFFWLICSEFTLSTLRDTPIDETDPDISSKSIIYRVNLGENKYKFGIATATFFLGKPLLLFQIVIAQRKVWLSITFHFISRRLWNFSIRVGIYVAKCTIFGVTKRWP